MLTVSAHRSKVGRHLRERQAWINALVQVRDAGSLDSGDRNDGGEKQSDSGCILKAELRFDNRLWEWNRCLKGTQESSGGHLNV